MKIDGFVGERGPYAYPRIEARTLISPSGFQVWIYLVALVHDVSSSMATNS